ncbi:MAG: globin family protein [Pseudomonadales bacterium]
MNDMQINLVKTTWESLTPNADKVALLFYSNLFEMEPEYRKMFGTDRESQGKKLMMMLNTAVRSLDVIESVVPAVQALGQRHVKYGVGADDYATVGAALLKTLEQGLGDAFTEETKEAWTLTYTTLSGVMIDAAAELEQDVVA